MYIFMHIYIYFIYIYIYIYTYGTCATGFPFQANRLSQKNRHPPAAAVEGRDTAPWFRELGEVRASRTTPQRSHPHGWGAGGEP